MGADGKQSLVRAAEASEPWPGLFSRPCRPLKSRQLSQEKKTQAGAAGHGLWEVGTGEHPLQRLRMAHRRPEAGQRGAHPHSFR